MKCWWMKPIFHVSRKGIFLRMWSHFPNTTTIKKFAVVVYLKWVSFSQRFYRPNKCHLEKPPKTLRWNVIAGKTTGNRFSRSVRWNTSDGKPSYWIFLIAIFFVLFLISLYFPCLCFIKLWKKIISNFINFNFAVVSIFSVFS